MLIPHVLSSVGKRSTYFVANRRAAFPARVTWQDNGASCERRITSKEMRENKPIRAGSRPSSSRSLQLWNKLSRRDDVSLVLLYNNQCYYFFRVKVLRLLGKLIYRPADETNALESLWNSLRTEIARGSLKKKRRRRISPLRRNQIKETIIREKVEQ